MKVKFKGKVYEDARRSNDGRIWFGQNLYEYCPGSCLFTEKVIIHEFKQVGNSYVANFKNSTAKVTILEEEG